MYGLPKNVCVLPVVPVSVYMLCVFCKLCPVCFLVVGKGPLVLL